MRNTGNTVIVCGEGNQIDIGGGKVQPKTLPKKVKNRIKKTVETLKMHNETFEQYMGIACQRKVFGLGSSVIFKGEEGIVVGWNRSCNYDVYFFGEDETRSVQDDELSYAT